MKDHEIALLVNQIRDIAVECRDAQQLRCRIANVLVPVLKEPIAPTADAQPVAWITTEQLASLNDLTSDAWVYWCETGHIAEPDEIPLFTAPPPSTGPAPLPEATRKAMGATLALGKVEAGAQSDGYVLVPVKITNAMIDAANNVPSGIGGSPPHWQWVWDAMIASAPVAPTDGAK